MNKYIGDYISRRKVEMENLRQIEQSGLWNTLHLGECEFSNDFPNEPKENFPYYDISLGKYYRYNPGVVTDEDYVELLKYVPNNHSKHDNDEPHRLNKPHKLSGWYSFSIVVTIITAFVMLFGLVVDDSGIVFAIGGGVFIYMLFFMLPIICLLAKIEYNQRVR